MQRFREPDIRDLAYSVDTLRSRMRIDSGEDSRRLITCDGETSIDSVLPAGNVSARTLLEIIEGSFRGGADMRGCRSGEPVLLPFSCSPDAAVAGDDFRIAGAGREPASEERCRLGDLPRFAASGSRLFDIENRGGGAIAFGSVVLIGD